MTALERALVVYAEAKGHEVEYLHKDNIQWNIKDTAGFNFEHFKYRIMNKKDYRKVYDELSDFFKPLYAPEQPSKLLSDMERVKYKPAGFSCKTKMYTREEIEKMTAEEQALEFQANAMRYELDKLIDPEQEEKQKEVDPIIEILEAYKRGERIELKEKYSDYAWSELWKGHIWNFSDFDYRIAPKVQDRDPLKITDKEILHLKRNFVTAKRIGDGLVTILNKNYITEPNEWLYFNAKSQKWQRGVPNE